MPNEINLSVSSAPHICAKEDARQIMHWVLLALLLPSAAGVFFFGIPALLLMLVTTATAVIAEIVFNWLAKKPFTAADGSAAVAGLLLALILPPALPLWMGAIGAVFAIVAVKGLFGGLGYNIFNPALAARAFLLASWPVAMTAWARPFDAVASATPLYLAKYGLVLPSYLDLFLGNRAGSLGETSALAIILGAGILFWKKIIDWPAPAAFIGTTAIFTVLLGKDPLFYCLSGGLLIGAFFMATDYVTTPVTTAGRFIFGLGCGILTVLIRFFGGFPEGVNYAILLMNMLTPVIDSYVRPRVYGYKKAY
ncbi:MAG: RnfABCDGE type electron transport complex subunit D [Candidatus Margulisbacteria bacterium]|nr:RnfABCDGE type electron transport complex subunit D [Candidatus Margulisiibacteriota bacterium]